MFDLFDFLDFGFIFDSLYLLIELVTLFLDICWSKILFDFALVVCTLAFAWIFFRNHTSILLFLLNFGNELSLFQLWYFLKLRIEMVWKLFYMIVSNKDRNRYFSEFDLFNFSFKLRNITFFTDWLLLINYIFILLICLFLYFLVQGLVLIFNWILSIWFHRIFLMMFCSHALVINLRFIFTTNTIIYCTFIFLGFLLDVCYYLIELFEWIFALFGSWRCFMKDYSTFTFTFSFTLTLTIITLI